MNQSWSIEQNNFESEDLMRQMESLFTLGNGYLGIRGDSILSGNAFQRGTFINGFYESGPIRYGEKAYGYAEKWQTIIPLPEGKEIDITVDGTKLFHPSGYFKKQKRTLNLKESHLLWEFVWCDDKGLEYEGSVKSLIPFHSQGTVLFLWTITLPGDESFISLKSSLVSEMFGDNESDDPRLPGHFNGSTLNITTDEADNTLSLDATGSGLILYSSMNHQFYGMSDVNELKEYTGNKIAETFTGKASKTVTIVKSISYSYGRKEASDLIKKSLLQEMQTINHEKIEAVVERQKQFMDQFWYNSDVAIEGDEEVQLSLRYNLFQLLQSTGRDGMRSIAAKGLSGSGYEGHYFWDAETYVLPFFIYTNPDIARSMLKYRISIVEKAGKRAQVMGHKGILFPWRTINGEECSAYFPAGTAQYHINSDIALGLAKYIDVSGDTSILDEGGAVLLAETARFWCDFGSHIKGKGFCFNGVTGPDEYTALVDNNYYTNISARENLKAAVRLLKDHVSKDELQLWSQKASEIYLPETKGVTPQDDSFLSKEPWDFASTREDQYPLLLHFHPLNIYRKQVLKQADVVMTQSLYKSELPPEQMKRNFDYYEQLTTGDSSLSACAQGINAHWLGYEDLAWEYFNETLHTDRKDLHKNVFHGLHTASMGGSYLMVLSGFLGLEQYQETVRFSPYLPEKIQNLTIKITLRKNHLQVVVDHKDVRYTALDQNIEFYHYDRKISLEKNESFSVPVVPVNKIDYKGFRPRK
jgi:alpha,alpha-trehalose phosphorylase